MKRTTKRAKKATKRAVRGRSVALPRGLPAAEAGYLTPAIELRRISTVNLPEIQRTLGRLASDVGTRPTPVPALNLLAEQVLPRLIAALERGDDRGDQLSVLMVNVKRMADALEATQNILAGVGALLEHFLRSKMTEEDRVRAANDGIIDGLIP